MDIFKNKHLLLLLLVFFATFAIRLYFELNSPLALEAYKPLNEAKSIHNTYVPTHKDGQLHSPFFNYLVAAFYPNQIALKIFFALCFSLTVFAAYYLAFSISGDKNASLISTLLVVFVPGFFLETISSFSETVIFIPLLLVFFTIFLHIESKKYIYLAAALSFLLPLISPAAIFLVFAFVIYLALTSILLIEQDKRETEMIIFCTFVVFWIFFLFFKKAFQLFGFSIFYGNIPEKILSSYFSTVSVPLAIALIGFLPLLFGISTVYSKIFEPKGRAAYLIVSSVFVVSIALWLKLIEIKFAFIFLGIFLAILSSVSIRNLFFYFQKTKFTFFKKYFYFLFFILVLFSSIIPSINYSIEREKQFSNSDIEGVGNWLNKNTPEKAIILVSPKEAEAIKFVAQRPVVLDDNYVLEPDANSIYEDISKIYTTPFETDALLFLEKYGVSYIVLSEESKKEFHIDSLKFVSDKVCFKEVYASKAKVYEIKCKLK